MTGSTDAGVETGGRIVVVGTGRVAIAPDLADARVGVAMVRPTVALARRDAAAALEAVIDAATRVGVDRADVRTTSLSLHPRYDHRETGPVLTGYEVTNTVAITVRDLGLVGVVIDAALEAGATSMDGVAFRVADPSGAEQEARRLAVVAATEAAETLAAAAQLRLDGVLSIVEGVADPGPIPIAKMDRLALAESTTPVEGGTQEIAMTVTVTFGAARTR